MNPTANFADLVADETIATRYGFQQLHVYHCPTPAGTGIYVAVIPGAGQPLPAYTTTDGLAVPAVPAGIPVGVSTTSAGEALDVAAANLSQ